MTSRCHVGFDKTPLPTRSGVFLFHYMFFMCLDSNKNPIFAIVIMHKTCAYDMFFPI